MVLPPRPLRLRPEFVRRSWTRVLGSCAPMLGVFVVVALWQGRAGYELAADMRAWSTGEVTAVRLVDTDVTVIAGIVRHVRVRAEFGRCVQTGATGPDHHYTVLDDYYTFFSDSVGDGPLSMRRDAATGRAALSWGMRDVPGRIAWLLFYGLALLGFGAFLGHVAWRALRALRIARAAALAADEVELEVASVTPHEAHGSVAALEIVFRIPLAPDDGPVGYRIPAAASPGLRTERFDLVDGRPLLLDGGTRLLALRPERGRAEVTVLREDGWPFALGADAKAALRDRLGEDRTVPPS